MEVFINNLLECGFHRNIVGFESPVVVLAVPGAGKTSCIRRLLRLDSRFEAWTFGTGDEHNTSGRFIRSISSNSEASVGRLVIIDEFQNGDWERFKPFAIFGDVAQLMLKKEVQFHSAFSKCSSHRVPSPVAKLLQEFDFELTSEREGCLTISGLLGSEPEGVVICFEAEVCEFLDYNGQEHKNPRDTLGLEFPTVTLVISGKQAVEEHRAEFYISCSRALNKLLILTPNPEDFTFGIDAIDSSS